jgi:predicted dehydrogenase
MTAGARIAMVGAGYFAQFQVAGWQACGVNVVAVCDLDIERARALAERFGIVQYHASYERMIEKATPDLIDVVLPPQAQAKVVLHSLDAGLPVICQKPFGTDLRQAQVFAARAAQAGRPLVVHENFRFLPWFREARRCIDRGMLGQLHGIAFRFRPGDGQGPRAYLERQPYFQEMPRLLVRETAIHFIDTFRFLVGEVSAVTAKLRRINPDICGEDAGLVIFEFANGATGLFDGSRLNDHVATDPRHTFGEMWLEGSAGVLRLDGEGRLWWKPHHADEVEHPYDRPTGPALVSACAALQAHVLAHLTQASALENSAADYMANLYVQEAIYSADAGGTRVVMANFTQHAAP